MKRLLAVLILVAAACSSGASTPKAAPEPPHTIQATLSLSGVESWEVLPDGGCQGTLQFDDLRAGTTVRVLAPKEIARGEFTVTRGWPDQFGRPHTCTLTAWIKDVPAASTYRFVIGDRVSGTTVRYSAVSRDWIVELAL